MGEDGSFSLTRRDPRHFYSTCRPYDFPEERPARPAAFDAWLEGRLPEAGTRAAFWEVLGATVALELHSMQRFVALLGPGRTG